jgi:hypothetical protein
MQITPAGEVFFAVTAGSLLVAIGLGRRVSERLKPGGGTDKFLVLVIFTMTALFAPFSYWTGKALFHLATKPSYSAMVVGYTSAYQDYDEKNANGDTVSGQRLMHTARVRFDGPNGEPVDLPSSVASTDIPIEESTLRVVYKPGDTVAAELSARSVGLLLAAGVMLLILGYGLGGFFWYAMGRSMKGYRALGTAFMLRVLLPGVTLLFMLALAYVPLSYFALGNPDRHPLVLACLAGFFALALLPVVLKLLTKSLGRD